MNLLQNNLVAQVLAGLLALLLLVALALGVAWTREPTPIEADREGPPDVAVDGPGAMPEIGDLERYAEFTARPAFNESRRPERDDAQEVEVVDQDTGPTEQAPPLKLTGVVITPDYKVATLTHEGNQKSFFAHEGEALSGDPDSSLDRWFLTEVNARDIVLAQRGGGELALELQVYDRAIDAPPPVERNVPPPGAVAAEAAAIAAGDAEPIEDGEDGEPVTQETRAEEIRRRIEERREELRRQQEQAENAAPVPSGEAYRTAIQNMIKASPGASNDTGNEESDDE